MIHSLEEIKKNMLIKLDTMKTERAEEWMYPFSESGSLTSICRMAGLSKEERAAMGKARTRKAGLEADF